MDWYKSCKLVKTHSGYTLLIRLNPHAAEFAKDLDSPSHFKEKILDLDGQIRGLVKERYSDIKINTVKLLLGALVVASIPFSLPAKVKAAVSSPSGTQASATSGFTTLNTTGVVLATKLNVRSGPSTDYSIIHKLWLGNKVKVIAQSTYWYKIRLSDGRTGWVRKTYLKIDMTQQKINTVISTAKSLVGTPYVWGGESPAEGGFDCSGLTQYVFKKAGYTLNRISADQARQGIRVSRQSIKPGDLVFYSFEGNGVINHVGIYIGSGQMIHSPKAGDTVKITNMTTSYWESRFVTSRRIII